MIKWLMVVCCCTLGFGVKAIDNTNINVSVHDNGACNPACCTPGVCQEPLPAAKFKRVFSVKPRQQWLTFRRPQIGEDQAVTFLHRIPGLAHLAPEIAAALRLNRHVEAVAFHVKQPAVVAASDAALLDHC